MILGLMLLAGSVVLFLYNQNENKAAEENSNQMIQKMVVEIEKTQQEEVWIDPHQKEMKEMQIDGEGYVGYLSIPAIHRQLPIRAQWSYPNLKNSPCRYYGSVHTDDFVIAAHNYKSHFGNIKNLKMGERIIFTDIEGNVYEYEAVEAVVLGPEEVEVLTNGEFELSLFTCTYDGSSRFVLRCAKIG